MTARRAAIRYPKSAQPAALHPRQVAKAYNFPMDFASGRGYVGAIIELGGGYKLSQVQAYFAAAGLPQPTFISVPTAGGTNKPDGPNGADGEVQLDMCVAGSIAPNATFRIYFCPNTDAGFLAGITTARADGCHGISISWGGPESDWSTTVMNKFAAAIAECRQAGIPVFVAAGDTGSQDSSGAGNQTDFPASAPDAIGCGGTRLMLAADGGRASEVVWNDSPTQSATGGGISKWFPGRQVPDMAGNADPDTGYIVAVDGQQMVVGGTSAVAPLYLGLHALLWEIDQRDNAGKGFDFGNLCATNPQAFFDVTQGNNGGYRAGPGRDDTTGLGVVDAMALDSALTSGIPAPVPPLPPKPTPFPPAPTPAPPPPPAPEPANPLADFPTAAVTAWGEHRHSHTHVEANAYTALATWAAEYGISLPL